MSEVVAPVILDHYQQAFMTTDNDISLYTNWGSLMDWSTKYLSTCEKSMIRAAVPNTIEYEQSSWSPQGGL